LKAFHLNLASRPHRDNSRLYTAAIVLGVLTLILMANNIQAAYKYLVNTRETREHIARVQAQSAKEEQLAAAAEQQAAAIDVKSLNARTTYINDQIANRAFSWSRLLDNLEQVLPRDVRFVAINPSVDKQGNVELQLTARSKNHDGLVNLLQNMNEHPKFDQAFPQSQSQGEGGAYNFAISVLYLPDSQVKR
jgi:type IV pilus assembly protein PilN